MFAWQGKDRFIRQCNIFLRNEIFILLSLITFRTHTHKQKLKHLFIIWSARILFHSIFSPYLIQIVNYSACVDSEIEKKPF